MGLYQVSSNNSPGVKFDPTPGVTSFTWDYIGKTLEVSLYLAIRPRLTKFCRLPNWGQIWPQPGGHKFYLGLYIGKTLEISLYLAIRPRLTELCMLLYLVSLNGECPNYSPGVKFGRTPGFTSFTWAYIGKTLEISMYQAIRPRLTKFCM